MRYWAILMTVVVVLGTMWAYDYVQTTEGRIAKLEALASGVDLDRIAGCEISIKSIESRLEMIQSYQKGFLARFDEDEQMILQGPEGLLRKHATVAKPKH